MTIKKLSTTVILSAATLLSAQSSLADKDYRILLTNDDGIQAAGLLALVKALSTDYEVVVSAPNKKRGGSSHGTYLWEGPMEVETLTLKGDVTGYSVHGLPADAARFGIITQRNLQQPVDLLISGANHGENLGSLSHLSGTIGAAMEGPYYGIPAIAVSLDSEAVDNNEFTRTAQAVKHLVEKVRLHGLPEGTILSVNVPPKAKGIRIAPMGADNVRVDGFTQEDSNYAPQFSYPKLDQGYTDLTVYHEGYIAVTPLKIDWTDRTELEALSEWETE